MCFEYVFTTTAGIKAHSLHHCLAGGSQLTWRCWLREWAQGCDIYINCHAICLALGFFLLLKKHFDFDQNQVLYYASVPFSLCSPKCRNARPRCANVCQSLWQKWWNPADVLSKSGNVDKSNTSHAENDRLQMRSTLNYCGELKSVTSSSRICKYVILQIVRAILLLAHLLINILK